MLRQELMQALKMKDWSQVCDLVTSGADIHVNDEYPARCAAAANQCEVLALMIAAGADLRHNNCAIARAASKNACLEAMKLLFRDDWPLDLVYDVLSLNNATKLAREMVRELICRTDRDVIISDAMTRAAELGDKDWVMECLALGAKPKWRDSLALRRAARTGDLEVVALLIQSGADVNAKNAGALVMACQGCHLDVVNYLFQAGANAELCSRPALQAAFDTSNLTLIQQIRQYVDKSDQWWWEQLLFQAVKADRIDQIKIWMQVFAKKDTSNVGENIFVTVLRYCRKKCMMHPTGYFILRRASNQYWPEWREVLDAALYRKDCICYHKMVKNIITLKYWKRRLGLKTLIQILQQEYSLWSKMVTKSKMECLDYAYKICPDMEPGRKSELLDNAIQSGQYESFVWLSQHFPELLTQHGKYILRCIMYYGQKEMLAYFMDKIDIRSKLPALVRKPVVTNHGDMVQWLIAQDLITFQHEYFYTVIVRGHFQMLKLIWPYLPQDIDKSVLMHTAVLAGRLNVVLFLLQEKVPLVSDSNILLRLLHTENLKMIRFLATSGVDISEICHSNCIRNCGRVRLRDFLSNCSMWWYQRPPLQRLAATQYRRHYHVLPRAWTVPEDVWRMLQTDPIVRKSLPAKKVKEE